MSDPGFSRRKQQLLDKFLAGEIDKPTYDALLADLHELGTSVEKVPAQVAAPTVDSKPSISITESRSPAERSALSQPVALLEVGMRLGEFELTRRLSRGGMGEVWQAYDRTGERNMVIKVLPPELQRSPDEMARVKLTFNRVHNLQHQHICPVYLLGQDARYGYYIVMKYIDGVTLAAHRKAYLQEHRSFHLREVLRLLSPIASALDYAHSRQIIHRDIKPQNIMLSADGKDVQIVDFGLAAEVRTSVMRISQTATETCGTYPYMAPEQWRGETQDARTDQYALAVVMFEMLAGRLPFEAADPAVLRLCVLSDPPPTILSAPAALNAVIAQGMAKSRNDRFESCTAFMKAIVKAATEQPVKPADASEVASKSGNASNVPRSEQRVPSSTRTDPETTEQVVGRSKDQPSKAGMVDASMKSSTSSSSRTESSAAKPSTEKSTAGKPSTPKRPKYDDVDIVEDDEEDYDEPDDAVLEVDEDRPARRSKGNRRNRKEGSLEETNAHATFWVSLAGGAVFSVVVGFFGWLAWAGINFLRSPSAPVGGSSQIASSDSSTANTQLAAGPATPGRPKEAPLRYSWENGKSYVYSVNLELEPDNDIVLSMTGTTTFTRGQAISQKNNPPDSGKGTGTGFVVHPNGYLVTCQHVVDDASQLEVAVGGKKYTAKVVIEDAEHDLAIIQIEASGLPTVPLADSDKVQVGEEVRAIGFPFSSILGDNIKATRGTISGINQEEERRVLQVDAGINPGNSGGPLVNERGEVVGVNFAKLREEMATNVGFAVPINDAINLLRGQGITFTSGTGRGAKLEGPELVKKISAATALITVTTGGGMGTQHFQLTCQNGTYNSSARSKAGHILDPATNTNLQRRHLHSMFSGGLTQSDVVETDALGRIHEITGGRSSIPGFQGPFSVMVLEQLPSIRRTTWSTAHSITVVFSEESGDGFGMSHRFRPRFRPPGFPGLPGFPGSQGTTKTTRVPGRVRISYAIQETNGDILKIKKEYELDARENNAANPRVSMKGTGLLSFDLKSGVPRSLEYSATLVENESGRSTTTPVRLSYTLRDTPNAPANGPGIVPVVPTTPAAPGRTAAPAAPQGQAPAPPEEPGKAVDLNDALPIGSKMLAEWAGKWLPVEVLETKPNGTVRIHWVGWNKNFDEDVARSRLRFPLNAGTK